MVAAAGEHVDLARLLLDLLIVVSAAKLAAELAERIRLPAVLGEIAAGVVIGPSVLGIVVATGDRGVGLGVLAEIGVVLLLLQVGLEMDTAELGKVGPDSLAVACAGVALPFAAGALAATMFGHDVETAAFIGAALTATSVGVTARVLGDLRALATVEARVVLGAAVADDVLGLLILTVVVKVATGGGVGPGSLAATIAIAVGFLLVAGVVGTAIVPALLDRIDRLASSSATVVVAAFALTLAFAELADAAKLAFIIGAFMAGIALGRSRHRDAIASDLGAVANVLVPVFFVLVGINTDLAAMTDRRVLGLAAALAVVAIVTKLAAGWAVRRVRVDRLLVGLGMVPRGEVGLIFASVGLSNGVLDAELYGALLLVVFVSTVVAPPLLRFRLGRTEQPAPDAAVAERPVGGWVAVDEGELVLRAAPPVGATVDVALETAQLLAVAEPSTELLDWFGRHRDVEIGWDRRLTPALLALLRDHSPRAWRLLDVTAVLERALPEVAAAMVRWRADIRDLDPLGALRFPIVDALLGGGIDATDDIVLLAAFCANVCGGAADERAAIVDLVDRLGRPDDAESIAAMVADARMLRAGTRDPDAFDRAAVLQFALHVASTVRVRQTAALAVALGELPRWQREALDERVGLLVDVLDHPAEIGGDAARLASARLATARRLAPSGDVAHRLGLAPRSMLLGHPPTELVRLAGLIEPPPHAGDVRVDVSAHGTPGRWTLDVVTREAPGLLAKLTDAMTAGGLDIVNATVATWSDGVVLDTFVVVDDEPDVVGLATAMRTALRRPVRKVAMPGLRVAFDNRVLPWHTSCCVTGSDRPGALHAVSAAFASAGVVVHSARVQSATGAVDDRFTVSDKLGRKLGATAMERVRDELAGRRSMPRWWPSRARSVDGEPVSQPGHGLESRAARAHAE